VTAHTAMLRLYAADELGPDGYPLVWHRCPRCKGTGKVGNPEHPDCCGTFAGGCGGSGSLKARVRSEAGNRCVRCQHPYQPGAGEWSRCDERCVHDGPLRVGGRPEVKDPFTAITPPPIDPGLAPPRVWVERGWACYAQWRILTVHHLGGPTRKFDCRWHQLVALCQRCHLEIQGKVNMERAFIFEHSAWFKPYAAGWYAWKYEGREIDRAEAEADQDRLLALERLV